MTTAATALWFARHELRLAWREGMAMTTGGKRLRLVGFLAGGVITYAILLVIAWFTLRSWTENGIAIDKSTLVLVSGTGLLFAAVTLSQALESVTRVYYARSDLDLLLSSPVSSRLIFSVRAASVVLTTTLLGCLLVSPIVFVLAIQSGPHWFAVFFVQASLSMLSTAVAMGITLALFRLVGPRRTRLIAQIIAAIVGAGFVIGIQAIAILGHEGFSRLAMFQSSDLIAAAPPIESLLWVPARAATGELPLAVALAGVSLAFFSAVAAITAPSYARLATAAAGLSHIRISRRVPARTFATATQRQTLRRKEWRLLQRDPWLISQTLMQMLYLVPPALLLWVNYGAGDGAFMVAVPVLVMAAGQLAGGLAWLAISGEDAHDLVATAPLHPATILRAKVEAVLAVIAVVLGPIIALMAFSSIRLALITGIFATLSAASATTIQLWFRVSAKRSMFRRRQTASRFATISEALVSIMWAGTGGLVAYGSWLAVLPAIVAVAVLGLARLIAPRPASH